MKGPWMGAALASFALASASLGVFATLLVPPLGRFCSSHAAGRHWDTWGCDLLSSFSSSWLFKRMSSVTWKVGCIWKRTKNFVAWKKNPHLELQIATLRLQFCHENNGDHHLQEPIFPTLSLRSDTVRKRNWSMGLTESPRHWVLITKAPRQSEFPTYFSEHCEWISLLLKVCSYVMDYVAINFCLQPTYCPTLWIVCVFDYVTCECCRTQGVFFCSFWMHQMDCNCLFAFNSWPLSCKTGIP